MKQLMEVIEFAQAQFKKRLEGLLASPAGLTKEQYARYLSMQHHLTRGVQKHFFQIAGHPDLARRRTFRKFLVDFANEEELHFEIAANDLKQLGAPIDACPLDVTLWWSYFGGVLADRPFVRLGATAVLENIAAPSRPVIQQLFARATYLTTKNSRFFTIHQHDETLPHGDEILAALKGGNLDENHWKDLVHGAQVGSILYLRMVDWALASGKIADVPAFAQGLIALAPSAEKRPTQNVDRPRRPERVAARPQRAARR